MPGILDVIKRWVSSQGDEAYQRKRREREAEVREIIIEHKRDREEAKDKLEAKNDR